MSLSSIVVRGFGSFGNGLLAILGFGGETTPVGPGICGDGAVFFGMGFGGTVLNGAQDGCSIDLGAAASVVFSGGHECGVVPMDAFGGEYI
jgi:hypothetical protein